MLNTLRSGTTIATVLSAALAGLVPPGVASAQSANCAPRDRVVERLAATYGETRQSMGLGANNAVMELFASHETGSWTITVTTPSGLTCLVASGQAYEALHEPLPVRGNDT